MPTDRDERAVDGLETSTPKGNVRVWLITFLIAFALYALTANKGPQWQDSGEQQIRMMEGRIEHMKARVLPARTVNNERYWREILGYLRESNELVGPLYELEKSGRLRQARGKQFIEDRLLAAGSMLAGIWNAAYDGAHIDEFRVKRLKERYPKVPGRKAKQSEKMTPAN